MRVFIVDDHEIVREGLRTVLQKDADIEVVGEAGTGAEALDRIKQTQPNAAVVDYRLPDTTGDQLCRQILETSPATAVIILTTYLNEEVVRQSLAAGAVAFVTKASGLDELRKALREIATTEPGTRPASTASIVHRLFAAESSQQAGGGGGKSLTPRQIRVLELVAEGLTYSEIAQKLSISQSTVRFHVQALKERVGARTKTELVATAIRAALISPNSET
ncbi:LuxR family two component transcriptional regulator [Williamsia limnetica]|uniref:LuxR family two component transcriptional regulator n=1 Tax=Williamsia limnetica TaxID=882452 RepID=A0A318RH51_WILLI|nr:response regulator transcription factor [Williamsia limnetica]PYE12452.1 LuxR family two component transcriptional regulator [Williamsia limnetica]